MVVTFVILALVTKTFLFQAFIIPSASMQNTLQVGDRVLVDKLSPWFGGEPDRGDVVVFHDPGGWLGAPGIGSSAEPEASGIRTALSALGFVPPPGNEYLIKRVIAVGGDTVECRRSEPVKVNGRALAEPYIAPGATPCDNFPVGVVKVPKDHLWVMGDNRDNSLDSRYQQLRHPGAGFVPVDLVAGRAFTVAWPVGHWSGL
ncbi:signal peptidase I [Streptomyces sp. NPDC000410]|uniref:signal peptidase I n=1 Tax=Streptomyces sp. NPDC000410 TaxID=3154254 RepID=UPI00333419EA